MKNICFLIFFLYAAPFFRNVACAQNNHIVEASFDKYFEGYYMVVVKFKLDTVLKNNVDSIFIQLGRDESKEIMLEKKGFVEDYFFYILNKPFNHNYMISDKYNYIAYIEMEEQEIDQLDYMNIILKLQDGRINILKVNRTILNNQNKIENNQGLKVTYNYGNLNLSFNDELINVVTIHNSIGQMIYNKNEVNSKEVNISNFFNKPDAFYILINTDKGNYTSKLFIQ